MQYVNIEKSQAHSIATVSDPRFKVANIFRDLEVHEHPVSKLKELVVQECQPNFTISTAGPNDQPIPGSSMFTTLDDYWAESIELMSGFHNNSPSQHTSVLIVSKWIIGR